MKKIVGTGLNGLVGSRIIELLKDTYEFVNISRSSGVDITSSEQVHSALHNSDASVVLHLAAKTDVDGCEKDKELGERGEAWKINVLGTQHIVDVCKKTGKKLIYISTDFVFDGNDGEYSEEDGPNPINWYGMTKYEGENMAQKLESPWVILRLAYPYGLHPHLFESLRAPQSLERPDPLPSRERESERKQKKDFVSTILDRLEKGQMVQGVTDHIFTPTYLDDIAKAIDSLITHDATGIYHVVGSESLSPYEAAIQIANHFNFDSSLIQKTTREEFFKGRAPRPYNLSMSCGKIRELGIEMRRFDL